MVAEAKEQTVATSLKPSSPAGESKSLDSGGNGCTLKVRKPYTITKQRERWSEEEHQKFIEALKLYGRAWRQIEEHVGTKTAIQIRSHAQKFFAKVTRDSNIDPGGSLNRTEIPPPRHKRKPVRPYPRILVDTEIVLGRDNLTPTSETHKSCLSPVSCATDSADSLLPERDDDHATPDFCLSMKTMIGSSPDNKSTTKFEEDSPDAEEPCISIKLFGKTVVVRDTPRLCLEAAGICSQSSKPDDTKDEKLSPPNLLYPQVLQNNDVPDTSRKVCAKGFVAYKVQQTVFDRTRCQIIDIFSAGARGSKSPCLLIAPF